MFFFKSIRKFETEVGENIRALLRGPTGLDLRKKREADTSCYRPITQQLFIICETELCQLRYLPFDKINDL
jgi:hypothetical protein